MIELPKHIDCEVAGEIKVRSACSHDLPAILGLLAQMHDETELRQAPDYTAIFDEILSSPSRALLVATKEQEAVAVLDLFILANLTRGGRPWAGIENLVVDADNRRQGIGGALVRVAIDLARQLDCYKVQLVSHERRGEAHDLYRQAGFDAPVQGYRRYL